MLSKAQISITIRAEGFSGALLCKLAGPNNGVMDDLHK